MAEGTTSVEERPTLPPPNLYNRAALEAFRNGAEKSEKLKKHPDLVVIFAGSSSKGLLHYYSDSDWVFLTQSVALTKKEAADLLDSIKIDVEFNRVVTSDTQFSVLKEYTLLAKEIDKRFDDMVDKGQIERLSSEFLKRHEGRPSLLQRAFASINVKPKVPNTWRNFGGSAFWNDFDQDLVLDTTEGNVAAVNAFSEDKKYSTSSFHQVLSVLSADADINAHEVSDGSLSLYQRDIVMAVRKMADSDPARYQSSLSVLRSNYRTYTRQPGTNHDKSERLTETQFRTDKGEPLLKFYKEFKEFPDIDQLEQFFQEQ